ncbi:Gfo/Idh/MocA family protein [Chondromyces crocatus]|uniref:Oxidoreductase n=1 Tax=Chondromyces crocatus TaxID=52 RepID=A0A0K1E5W0_CHOCO|nr:Gfo/Idh/MocA family oxidoreductase [Chondromyces crocatus]AKT35963.1 oxidoreductase [Chondromyces crocatus]
MNRLHSVHWGMIGAGSVTEIKSGPAFQKAEGSLLTAVMRRTQGAAQEWARRHDVPRYHETAEDLIFDPHVDAIYIATPPGTHLDIALMACEARKPVYVEKPMARNYEECKRMNEAFEAIDVPLFVAYYRRKLPRFVTAKEQIDGGRLGLITGVSYRYTHPRWDGTPAERPWRLRPEYSGGGLFLDLGCHTLDLLEFLLGPLRNVSGMATNVVTPCAVEDNIALHFRTEQGALGIAHWNFGGHAKEDVIEITGTDARLRMSTFGDEPLEFITKSGIETMNRPNPLHVQQPLIQSIVDHLRGQGECPSTGYSAARTSRVMDVVLDAYYGGRADDFWLRPETWPGAPRR